MRYYSEDGHAGIREMALASRQHGLKYLATQETQGTAAHDHEMIEQTR